MSPNSKATSGLPAKIKAMESRESSPAEIQELIETLEKLADTDPDSACSLMADLWPIAADAYMHDVCDSINLWIDDHRSPIVIEKLKELSTHHPIDTIRRHWLGLLNAK